MSEKTAIQNADNARLKDKAVAKAAAKKASPKGLRVAAGKSVTSPRGILGPGEPVTEADFKGGKAVIDAFLEKEILTK